MSEADLKVRQVAAVNAIETEINRLHKENLSLRRQLPAEAPKLTEMFNRAQVSMEQLVALKKAQADGSLKSTPGKLHEVLQTDQTGRQTSHFFGAESAAWEQFGHSGIRVGRINTGVR